MDEVAGSIPVTSTNSAGKLNLNFDSEFFVIDSNFTQLLSQLFFP